jgi:hypothetical protein
MPSLKERQSALHGASLSPVVSIQGNMFTLVDTVGNRASVMTHDPKSGPYLDCCIIDAGDVVSRIYYENEYDATAAKRPPDCWSDNGTAPSVNASKPQAVSCSPDPEGVTGCKWSVWGSATGLNAAPVPACKSHMKLALMVAGYDMLFLLRAPPTAIRPWKDYVAKFAPVDFDICDVITRISFLPGGKVGQLVFDPVGQIDAETKAKRDNALASHATDGMVGRLDRPRPAALPPMEAARPLPPPATSVATPSSTPATPFSALPNTFAPAPAPFAPTVAEPPPEPARRGRKPRQAAAPLVPVPPKLPVTAAPLDPPFQDDSAKAANGPVPWDAGDIPASLRREAPQHGIAQPVPPDPATSKVLSGFFKK